MGRAAVCAGGRRPAREIATREPPARSGRSRGPPWPCRHPPAPRPGPAGPAAAFLLVVLVAPLVFRAPSGPAAREARRPHFVRRRASKPARALRSLRRPPHRRRLWFWCECACYGPAAAFRVGGCGECGRIRIGCRYPDVCYLSGCVAAWARWPPCGPTRALPSNFARNSPEGVSGFEIRSLIFRGFRAASERGPGGITCDFGVGCGWGEGGVWVRRGARLGKCLGHGWGRIGGASGVWLGVSWGADECAWEFLGPRWD